MAELNAALKAGLAEAKTRCAANGSGWGQDDSIACIKAAYDVAIAQPSAENTAGAEAVLARFCNPSAARQWLESKDVALLRPEPKAAKGKGSALADAMKALAS